MSEVSTRSKDAEHLTFAFACSSEFFGNSSKGTQRGTAMHFAQPLLFVSQRVACVFLDLRVRGVKLIPAAVLPG